MSKERKIVVEGKNYTWMYHKSGVFVRDENRKKHNAGKLGEYVTEDTMSVKPHHVAAWIRKELLNLPVLPKPPISAMEASRRAVPPIKQKEYIYIVEFNNAWWNEYTGQRVNDLKVVGYFKNPQDAINLENELNAGRSEDQLRENKEMKGEYPLLQNDSWMVTSARRKQVELQ